jgi:DNA-binding MarR family transcriptional regulator
MADIGRSAGGVAPPGLGEQLDFLRLIWAVDHAMYRLSKRMAARVGVTGSQRLVVRIVGRFPGITSGRLAKLLHLHPSTLTGVLKRLEAKGLLRRRVDPRDGRRTLFGLTAKGRRFDAKTAGVIEAAIGDALSALTKDQIAAAKSSLAAVVARLEDSI